ncbi:MBL fold metallo-hydrolase [Legionella sp. PC997]|uniref:MBL fold metallo-hydrolase n=1 Tax=Legionella sp. PC997 TaxID=2755562 RepID=UPI0015FB28AA|nr:MBL fold metallo-hydrolase [Legionella sp. PC997]QMT60182.1 hypothetical protein HBNCFIEN_01552 [Legionella sp. PC997]
MPDHLNEVSNIQVIVLMDNVSDIFTKSHEEIRWNEYQYQFEVRKRRKFSSSDLCRACSGLSLLIKLSVDNKKYTLLFDAGPDGNLFLENVERLGVNIQEVDAVFISHGHSDHYGGLIKALDAIGKKDIPVYVHPDLFTPRAFDVKDDRVVESYLITKKDIEKYGGKIFESRDPIYIMDNLALISGEVPRKNDYEKGAPGEMRKLNDQWQPEPLVIEERAVIFNLKNKGLCVFTGCGHPGVVNTCRHAIKLTALNKIYLVMGGFHLAGPTFEPRINPTVADLSSLNPDYVITGHCTGSQAQSAFTETFKDRHIPYSVATVFNFSC